MKKLLFILFVATSLISEAQSRIPNLPKAIALDDTDYVVINKSDSVITKITMAKYVAAYINAIKDTTPSTGNTVTITSGYKVLCIHGVGTLAALTIKLPSSPINSQVFTITSDQIVTSLTLSGGTTVTSYTSLAVGTPIKLIYNSSLSKWFNK